MSEYCSERELDPQQPGKVENQSAWDEEGAGRKFAYLMVVYARTLRFVPRALNFRCFAFILFCVDVILHIPIRSTVFDTNVLETA